MPAAVQRIAISPDDQRFTLREVRRTHSIIDSHGFAARGKRKLQLGVDCLRDPGLARRRCPAASSAGGAARAGSAEREARAGQARN